MIHPTYKSLARSIFGKDSIVDGIPPSSINKYFEKALSNTYTIIDTLNKEINDLKQQHIDDVLELKLKLSNLIDINYNLLQELKGQDVNRTNR